MEIMDGILDYNFAMEYGTSLFRKMVVERNVVGYPLTKM